jgi:hypothetical protein
MTLELDVKAPLGESGAGMQGQTTRGPNHRRSEAAGQGPRRWPNNLRMTGLILDSQHAGCVGELIGCTRNMDACALLAQWRRTAERFPFAVVAGPLHQAGGVVGGLAATWEHALALFRLACSRFDEIAAHGEDLSSAWLLFVSDDRRIQVEATIAQCQQTAGSA